MSDINMRITHKLAEHTIWGYNGSEIARLCNARHWRSSIEYAAHQADAVADLLLEAQAYAWDEGKDAVWAFMSNQNPRRERPANPYKDQP